MRLLFVCTGNTCRSPLAEAAWRAVSGEFKSELERAGLGEITASSAGLNASRGGPAARNSVLVARDWGIDLSDHRSVPLTPELVHNADLVLTMTADQAHAICERFPAARDRVRSLGSYCGEAEAARLESLWPGSTREDWPGPDIEDPFGGSLEEYRECGRQIRDYIHQLALQLIASRH
jgi:protein-tyrosine-phosphatase